MSVTKLVTALTVSFAVSVVVLIAELLFVLRRRRSSQPPISGDEQQRPHSAKQYLLCFLCLKMKSQTRVEVEPSGAPTQNPDESSPEDNVIDVFKLLESNGPSRVLCTIKEDDREDVESACNFTGIDSGEVAAAAIETEKMSLRACLDSEAEEERALKVEGGINTALSSPCDSPMFFTPMGSPSRDGMVLSEVVVSPVIGSCCESDR